MIENSFGFLGWKDMAQRKWVRNTIIKKHIMPTQKPSIDIEFCYQRKHAIGEASQQCEVYEKLR